MSELNPRLEKEMRMVNEQFNELMSAICFYQKIQMDKFSEVSRKEWNKEEMNRLILISTRMRVETKNMLGKILDLAGELDSVSGGVRWIDATTPDQDYRFYIKGRGDQNE